MSRAGYRGSDNPEEWMDEPPQRTPSSLLFRYGIVGETDHAANLPRPVSKRPQVNEPGLAGFPSIGARMAEPVNSNLNRAVVMQRMDLKGISNQFATHLATNVLSNGIYEVLLADGQSVAIVI